MTLFVGESGGGFGAEGGKQMVRCLISNVIAKNKVRIIAVSNTNEALMGLNLTERASGEPLNIGFKVCPDNIPLPLAGNCAVGLEIVDARKGSGGVGVYNGGSVRRARGILHNNGEAGEFTEEARLWARCRGQVADTEVSAMRRSAVEKGDCDPSCHSEGGVGRVATAIGEPLSGMRIVDVVGGLKGNGALIGVGEEEDRGIEGGHLRSDGRRSYPWKEASQEGALKSNTAISGRACGEPMENSVGLLTQSAQWGNGGIKAMCSLASKECVGEALYKNTTAWPPK
jgi:hypothetical protein